MKIALVQINPIIGDFDYNIEKIVRLSRIARKEGCDLAVFPELAICGYPPQDLLERQAFLRHHDAAFHQLVELGRGIGIICGIITRHSGRTGKPLHNSAVLIEDGMWQSVHKQLLPTYDVFDEARYFEPAQERNVLNFKGMRIGLTICEDIFNEVDAINTLLTQDFGEYDRPNRLYEIQPVAELFKEGLEPVDLLVNISASPFHTGKLAAKLDCFSKLCQRYNTGLIYVNQVGGQDSLLFDGQSVAVDRQGQVQFQGRRFEEDMVIVDTMSWQKKVMTPFFDQSLARPEACLAIAGDYDPEAAEIFDALVAGTYDYVKKCGFKQAVIGLSGGIDSALTAAIAVEALGAQNVMGVALPSVYSSKGSVDDARQLADNLKIVFHTVPIHDIFLSYLRTLSPIFQGRKEDVTEQNIQARIRGNLLMSLANKLGRMLLSTGNKSEMAVGYCTLYGDMSGGLAVISDVPKLMVYRICRYLNRVREIIPWATIDKPPSAELAPNQEDQDDLPPYEILDQILEAHLEENLGLMEIVERGFDYEVVKDVLRRVRINEHKRKQAPIGLKVTSKAFGYGRRYPICQGYRER